LLGNECGEACFFAGSLIVGFAKIKKAVLQTENTKSIAALVGFLIKINKIEFDGNIEWINDEIALLNEYKPSQPPKYIDLDWEILPSGWWLEPEYRK
jgi:hypothetical protein